MIDQMMLTDNGKQCSLDEWLDSPERILKYLNIPRTSQEIHSMRWGSYVPFSVDINDLKECKRRGLVTYDKDSRLWSAI